MELSGGGGALMSWSYLQTDGVQRAALKPEPVVGMDGAPHRLQRQAPPLWRGDTQETRGRNAVTPENTAHALQRKPINAAVLDCNKKKCFLCL